jgi:hypothetical protein
MSVVNGWGNKLLTPRGETHKVCFPTKGAQGRR